MDNEALLELFNLCIQLKSTPTIWVRTTIIGILKRNLPDDDASSYRTIGLESVLLKLLTLLIHLRLYAWAEANNIIPASQNGFRHGYRTNNNVFILRTLIEKYRALDQPLYVAFVDISNAFPSTNRDILWVELHRRGCSGPIIDWLRSLYENMRYIVRSNGDTSEEFESSVGVLIGDPSSPTLWNIFLSDFDPPAHDDDPYLGTTRVDHMEHADDGTLISLSAHGLQSKLSFLFTYAGRKQLLTNAIKTHLMVFNPLPLRPFTLYLGNTPLTYVTKTTYVGVTFSSDERNIYRKHYADTKKKANKASWAITGAERVLHDLPPAIARLLYTARLDPILSSAADVAPDVGDSIVPLEKIQISFLQRVIGLSGHSMKTPLFTELNLMPLRFRRATLALRFLRYALEQPAGRLLHAAINEALALYDTGFSGWMGDLVYALRALPRPVTMPPTALLRQQDAINGVIANVDKAMRAHLLADIVTSPRLYLMNNRLEPQKRGPPKKTLLQFRHYLNLPDREDRKAFVRLFASEHPFALEKLRHSHKRNLKHYKKVDRDKRLCRFCTQAVESPEHALLVCAGHADLVTHRTAFFERLEDLLPAFIAPLGPQEALPALRELLAAPNTVAEMAEFIRTVFGIFKSVKLVWPPGFVVDV